MRAEVRKVRARLLVLAILAMLAALPVTADAQRSDSRVWWEEKRKAYPQCNALTNEHEGLTDELERIAEQARYAKEPQRKQFVDKMNATAKQRTAVQDKLFACIRASGSKPNTADRGQKKPPLQGKVEESETPQKPPPTDPPNYPGPYDPGPANPGVVVIPERPGYPPPGRPGNLPQPLPGPKHPDETPERIPPRRPPPEVRKGPKPPTRDGPSLEAGLRKGFAECGQMFRNLGLAALAAVHPQFILENRNYVEAAKYLGVTSSDQGLRFLFHEITAPTVRGGLTWEESCDKNVGDEEAGLRIARRLCFWGLPNPTYKALKGARPKPKPQPGLPGSPTNPLTEAEVMEGLGQFNRPDLRGQTIALPPPDSGLNLGKVTLGERLGQGKLKDVYAIEGQPGLTLQIVHHLKDAAPSVTREMKGYDLIKNDIKTPTVHAHRSAPGGLSYTVKDRLPNEAFFSKPTPELLDGMGRTQGKLAGDNKVWIDGHAENHYIAGRDTQGRPVIGIHDTDMITLASDPTVAAEMSRLIRLFQNEPAAGMRKLCVFEKAARAGTLDGPAFMRETWRLRYDTTPPF